MKPGAEAERDVTAIRLPCWGRVVPAEGVVPWVVVDPAGEPVEPILRFLRDFAARDNRRGSVRSYCYALLRWWRWLKVIEVEWDEVTSAEVRDFVLWLRQAVKPRLSARTVSAATAGTINPVTRKQCLDDSYQPRTVQHGNAVVRSFYEFWIEAGSGPLVNPVVLDRRGGRAHAHHNPLEPFGAGGRIRYNPKVPRRRPREIPDERWKALFAALRSNRDRAIVALAVSNGARASEILGIRGVDLDWGEQLVRVWRKGSGAAQWLPASPEAFVWIRLYLAEIGLLGPEERIWRTLRRRGHGAGKSRGPLNYEALRAVFRRVNALLGANYSAHDLRHTCSLRMEGRAHLSTTADVYLAEDEQNVIRRVSEYLTAREQRQRQPPPPAAGYDAADLAVLLGGAAR